MSKNKPLIFQNKNKYFIFEKDNWNYSVNILFEHEYDLNIVNFFLIIKSYINKPEILINNFYIIAKNNSNEKLAIFRSISLKKLEKMQYVDFEIFIEDLINNDEMYINFYKYYGIKITFHPLSYNWNNDTIYPIYPWKNDVDLFFYDKINKEKQILILNKKISILKKLKYRVYNDRFNKFRKKIPK